MASQLIILVMTIVQALSGICAAYEEGFHFPSIDVEDITVSASSGRVKVSKYRTLLRRHPNH